MAADRHIRSLVQQASAYFHRSEWEL